MSVEFKVQGKPPKKDGANSMWGKKSEAQNIVNLRKAAITARNELNITPFTGRVSIDLTIYADNAVIESMGDLDNFITGICDGLQAADPRANMQDLVLNEGTPYQPVLYYSEAKVVNIQARKIPIENQGTHYTSRARQEFLSRINSE